MRYMKSMLLAASTVAMWWLCALGLVGRATEVHDRLAAGVTLAVFDGLTIALFVVVTGMAISGVGHAAWKTIRGGTVSSWTLAVNLGTTGGILAVFAAIGETQLAVVPAIALFLVLAVIGAVSVTTLVVGHQELAWSTR